MALGGFIHYSHDWLPHADTQTDIEAAMNAIISWMDTWTNWSVATTLTSYAGSGANRSWYWVMSHTGGARLVFIFNTYTAGTMIHADNDAYAAARSSTSFDWSPFWVAYLAPSVAALGAGTPASAGWLPTGTMKFTAFGAVTDLDFISVYSTTTPGFHRLQAMVRGDEVILTMTVDAHLSSETDAAYVCSNNLFTKLVHATDTSALKGAGAMCFSLGVSPSSGNTSLQGMLANGTSLIRMAWAWLTGPVSTYVNDRPPWAWSEIRAHVSDADLTTNGIVAGNGMKGAISSELVRVCNRSTPYLARLESGNLVHIAAGLVLGYDTSNGDYI